MELVKERFNKKLQLAKAKIYLGLVTLTMGTVTCTTPVYAAGDAENIVIQIIDAVVYMFPLIGIVIALVGAFKLYMAFRNDQPDSYSNAVKDIVIGGLLVVFKSTIWNAVLKPML